MIVIAVKSSVALPATSLLRLAMILRSVFHMGDFGHNSCGLVFLVAESHVPSWPLEESSRKVKTGLADCTGVTWNFIFDSQWAVVL